MAEDNLHYEYSRILPPRCFDAGDSFGTVHNLFFWGCAIDPSLSQRWLVDIIGVQEKFLDIDDYISKFADDNGRTISVVRPSSTDVNVDWLGSTYGVSTRCSAIPQSRCQVGSPYGIDFFTSKPFECNHSYGEGFPEKRIYGNLTSYTIELWFDDWHQYMRERPPFTTSSDQSYVLYGKPGFEIIVNDSTVSQTTLEDSNLNFRNPWHWLSQIHVSRGIFKPTTSTFEDDRAWDSTDSERAMFILSCETTGK